MAASARQGGITGRVIDDAGRPAVAANIFLLRAVDSVFIKAALADDKGNFDLAPVDDGEYILKVTLVGYAPAFSARAEVSGNTAHVPDITLKPEGKQMKEVTVKAQKQFMEVHADKLVVNVDNSVVSAASSVMEVLARSPGVLVDPNDNISLKGKQGVNVMIDGRIVPMTAADLASMLKSMPANTVDKIELISNPSARYDAAGTAGIINIKMKKDQKMGLNGSITLAHGQGNYGKESGSFNLNYRQKKLSVYASYSSSFRGDFHHVDWTRQYFQNNVFQKAYVQKNNSVMDLNSQFASLGMDYDLTTKTKVGISVTGGNFHLGIKGYYQGLALDSLSQPSYKFITSSNSVGNWNNIAPNIHLQHTFDSTGRELTVDVDYGRYWNRNNQDVLTNYTRMDGSQLMPDLRVNGHIEGLTQIRSVKADFTQPLKNNARIEAGFKASYVTADNAPTFYDVSGATPVYLSGYSNHFIYTENINAAYFNASKDWKKWSTQLGLRIEQTNITGDEKTTNQTFRNTYTQLFPSFAVQNHVNKSNDIGITLSRRIARARYEDLNPYVLIVDPTTQKVGNPYLRPDLTYSMELSHVYKQRLVTSVNYSITSNVITEAVFPSTNTQDKVTIQTKKNLSAAYYYGVSGAYTIPIFKWWTNITSFDWWYSRYEGTLSNT